jgi:hypothetical protein
MPFDMSIFCFASSEGLVLGEFLSSEGGAFSGKQPMLDEKGTAPKAKTVLHSPFSIFH